MSPITQLTSTHITAALTRQCGQSLIVCITSEKHEHGRVPASSIQPIPATSFTLKPISSQMKQKRMEEHTSLYLELCFSFCRQRHDARGNYYQRKLFPRNKQSFRSCGCSLGSVKSCVQFNLRYERDWLLAAVYCSRAKVVSFRSACPWTTCSWSTSGMRWLPLDGKKLGRLGPDEQKLQFPNSGSVVCVPVCRTCRYLCRHIMAQQTIVAQHFSKFKVGLKSAPPKGIINTCSVTSATTGFLIML